LKTETDIEFVLNSETRLTIQLVDNMGSILKELTVDKLFEKGKNSLKLNVQETKLEKGIYYIAFYDNVKSKFIKIIVE
jgi:hypothetical protein